MQVYNLKFFLKLAVEGNEYCYTIVWCCECICWVRCVPIATSCMLIATLQAACRTFKSLAAARTYAVLSVAAVDWGHEWGGSWACEHLHWHATTVCAHAYSGASCVSVCMCACMCVYVCVHAGEVDCFLYYHYSLHKVFLYKSYKNNKNCN